MLGYQMRCFWHNIMKWFVDISKHRIDAVNARISIIDTEISEYLNKKELNLTASLDLKKAVRGASYVIANC